MDVKSRKFLVVGMARSGLEVVKLIHQYGGYADVTDAKALQAIEGFNEIAHLVDKAYLGRPFEGNLDYDAVIMSPGVPLTLAFVQKAISLKIPVISEVEFAFSLAKGRCVGITGTNGKTTTTSLIGEIFTAAGFKTSVVGNIGIPVSQAVRQDDSADRVYVTELSSYQLETCYTLKPWIAAFLNLTPDHLARHGTMQAYQDAKERMFMNMDADDVIVLNADDSQVAALGQKYPACVMFSRQNQAQTYVESDGYLLVQGTNVEKVIHRDDLIIKGDHNVENALAALAVCHQAGISLDVIAKSLKAFKGVEHRNEFVGVFKGISVYNDSKATNPEASMPAIKSMTSPTILVAGGMDKGSDYTGWIKTFKTIKHVVLLGETKAAIGQALKANGFSKYTLVKDMKEAVDVAVGMANSGEAILLSPACASWDMYPDMAVRGREFKALVKAAYGVVDEKA